MAADRHGMDRREMAAGLASGGQFLVTVGESRVAKPHGHTPPAARRHVHGGGLPRTAWPKRRLELMDFATVSAGPEPESWRGRRTWLQAGVVGGGLVAVSDGPAVDC